MISVSLLTRRSTFIFSSTVFSPVKSAELSKYGLVALHMMIIIYMMIMLSCDHQDYHMMIISSYQLVMIIISPSSCASVQLSTDWDAHSLITLMTDMCCIFLMRMILKRIILVRIILMKINYNKLDVLKMAVKIILMRIILMRIILMRMANSCHARIHVPMLKI